MFSKDWPTTATLLMRAGHLHKCFVIINITQCPITGTARSVLGPMFRDLGLRSSSNGSLAVRRGRGAGHIKDISKNVAFTFVSCLRCGHGPGSYFINALLSVIEIYFKFNVIVWTLTNRRETHL